MGKNQNRLIVLKVSKFWTQIMVSSILPKKEQKNSTWGIIVYLGWLGYQQAKHIDI